ncbi:ribonuclease HI [Synechococcus moorigangaii CMS01]|nr:ribonuclease HI [Synechococcus moorigangaii CMS01]
MAQQRTIDRIYTDGGCIHNPGPGGWGVVVQFSDGSVWEMGDRQPETTNNRMEMQAAIQALEFVQTHSPHTPVRLLTDSKYVIDGITKWIKGWQKKGWKTAAGKPVLNQDLWQQLNQLNSPDITWCHVKGHSGEAGNERADAIANGFARGQSPALKTPKVTKDLPKSRGIPLESNRQLTVDLNFPLESDSLTFHSSATEPMTDAPHLNHEDIPLSHHERVQRLTDVIESLRIADEIAAKGYFISSSELADLMDVNASAVTSRGHEWTWRNWIVSRVKREGNQILWQLDRIIGDETTA